MNVLIILSKLGQQHILIGMFDCSGLLKLGSRDIAIKISYSPNFE
jgi:hypothetical protein